MSYGQARHICESERERNRKERLLLKLDIAEAVNFGYVGSQGGRKNARTYSRWRKSIYKLIYPESYKKQPVLWDRLGNKSSIL